MKHNVCEEGGLIMKARENRILSPIEIYYIVKKEMRL